MAKSLKLDDYWKQHNIELLFKDITHTLAQRMPDDPVLGIVEYLQKKYPKSFKVLPDANTGKSLLSKPEAIHLKNSIFDANRSKINVGETSIEDLSRRASISSQTMNAPQIPGIGSAFTGLLRQNTSLSENVDPLINLRQVLVADRLGQSIVKLGKNIRSNRDILEDEIIKPTRAHDQDMKKDLDEQYMDQYSNETTAKEEPTTLQLIKYKQQIRLENDRRLHREKLAELAQQVVAEEKVLQSNQAPTAIDHRREGERSRSKNTRLNSEDETHLNQMKMFAKSRIAPLEKELLDDEMNFGSSLTRRKANERKSQFPFTLVSKLGLEQNVLESTMARRNSVFGTLPTIRMFTCQNCGSTLNVDSNEQTLQPETKNLCNTNSQLEVQQSIGSESEAIDDWFDDSVSTPNSMPLPSTRADQNTPQLDNSTVDTNHHFQPIKDQFLLAVKHRPPVIPTIVSDDDNGNKRNRLTRMSVESDVFVRTPDPPTRRNSFARGIDSPTAKRQHTSSPLTSSPRIPPVSPSFHGSVGRRSPGWSFHENDADD